MIGCTCVVCTSDDPRDVRTRTGLSIEHDGKRIQIDISADFRQQMLRERISQLDAILVTHAHADHILGLDDIRPFCFRQGEIPVFASGLTWKWIERIFHYIFAASPNSAGRGLPQVRREVFNGPFKVIGLEVTPIPVVHGRIEVSAFRITDGIKAFAFITDCNLIPDSSLAQLHGLDLLIIDALRYKPHSTHLHLEQTLAYIDHLRPRRALLTHMGHDFKHAVVSDQLPSGVGMAWDGLQVVL